MKDIYLTVSFRVVLRTDQDISAMDDRWLAYLAEQGFGLEYDGNISKLDAEVEDNEVLDCKVLEVRDVPSWDHPLAPWNQVSSEERGT